MAKPLSENESESPDKALLFYKALAKDVDKHISLFQQIHGKAYAAVKKRTGSREEQRVNENALLKTCNVLEKLTDGKYLIEDAIEVIEWAKKQDK